MGKTKIETVDRTWNPVTGCLHGCNYCYARQIAHRFRDKRLADVSYYSPDFTADLFYKGDCAYPYGFRPTFHRYRLDDLPKKPSIIFVCSMGDLFGEWVPDEWIAEVLNACQRYPQHIYQFYTKNPSRYHQDFIRYFAAARRNVWMGTSITGEHDKTRILELVNSVTYNTNTFLSIEPILEPIDLSGLWLCEIEWVIIGALTGPGAKKQAPRREWVEDIVGQCRAMGVPVFLKDSLAEIWGGPLIQEWPRKMKPPVAVE